MLRESRRLWLLALAFALLPAAVRAGGGPIFALPQMGVKNKSGLILSIDGRGVEGNGYRPLRVEVTPWPPTPLTADRQIRLVIKPQSYNALRTPQVTQIIDLPEGSTSVKATISVPQSALWYSLSITTYEGGEKLEDLTSPYLGWSNNYWDWTEDRPAMLFIDPAVPPRVLRDTAVQSYRGTGADSNTHDLPDIRAMVLLFPDPNRGGTPMSGTAALVNSPKPTDVMLLAQVNDMGRVEMLPPAELPPRWLDLSQYDVITIKLKDLQTLAGKQPEQFAALKAWLLTGPLLNVYDVGGSYERLAELEKLLGLAALPIDGGLPEHRGWSLPDMNVKKHELRSAWEMADYTVNSYPPGSYALRQGAAQLARKAKARSTSSESPSSSTAAEDANTTPKTPPFLFRRAGLGCVVAIAAEKPFPGQDVDWIWLFNTVPDSHWKWFRRNGYSLHRTNDDYWTFLIPGVGEAPVVSFLLLVSLFAIVIGPVNYVFLDRSRRLYLLLLTVPLGAAIVTLCLFTYALTTDGLSVRLRSRSFTDLNQRTGEAAAWSRQSYYAAIAPSAGLVYPDDTTVFSIEHQPSWRHGDPGGISGKLTWDEGQHLKSGYLASRTATQFMVQRATKTPIKLVVKEGTAAGESPSVENLLDSPIQYLLLRDSRGDYFFGEALAKSAKANLTKTHSAGAEAALRKLARPLEPALPRGYDPNVHNNNALSFLNPNYSWGNNVDGSAGRPLMAASLLEKNIVESLLPTQRPLELGTYTAIVESSAVVPLGVPRVRQEASFHVIRGRY